MTSINDETVQHTESREINCTDIRAKYVHSWECHFESEAASLSKLIIEF